MIIAPGFVGIDVSKHHLDIFDGGLGGAERIDNRADAVTALVERWRGRGVFVLFEATGRYDALLRHALAAGGVAHARVNPARARDFARATGALAKTDAIDAKLLAAMAMTLRPRADKPQAQNRERLARLNLRRDQLVADRARERARREALDDPLVAADIAAHIAFLAERIAAIEAAIARLVKAEPTLADDARLLRSAPGFGPVAAATLIAAMPELGARSSKTIAALAGLAPFNRDSGAMRGKRAIRGGRRRVRKALYMAAVTAIRSQPRFAEAYKAFIARGKPAKVALVAIARKLLVIANAILRDKTAFNPNHA